MSLSLSLGVRLGGQGILGGVLAATINGLETVGDYAGAAPLDGHAGLSLSVDGVTLVSQSWEIVDGDSLGTGTSPTPYAQYDNGSPDAPALLRGTGLDADGNSYVATAAIRAPKDSFATLPVFLAVLRVGVDADFTTGTSTGGAPIEMVSLTRNNTTDITGEIAGGVWPVTGAVGDTITAQFAVVTSGGRTTVDVTETIEAAPVVTLSGLDGQGRAVHDTTLTATVTGLLGGETPDYLWLDSDGGPLVGEQEQDFYVEIFGNGELNDGEFFSGAITLNGVTYSSAIVQAVFPAPTITDPASLPAMAEGAPFNINLGDSDFGSSSIEVFTVNGVDRSGDLVGVQLPSQFVIAGPVELQVRYTSSGGSTLGALVTGSVVAGEITTTIANHFVPVMFDGQSFDSFPQLANMLDASNYSSTAGTINPPTAELFFDGNQVTSTTQSQTGQVPSGRITVTDTAGGVAVYEFSQVAVEPRFSVTTNANGDIELFVNDRFTGSYDLTFEETGETDITISTSNAAIAAGPVSFDDPVLAQTGLGTGDTLSVANLVALTSTGTLTQTPQIDRDGTTVAEPYTIDVAADEGLVFTPEVVLDDGTNAAITEAGTAVTIPAGYVQRLYNPGGNSHFRVVYPNSTTAQISVWLVPDLGTSGNQRIAYTNGGQLLLQHDQTGAIRVRAEGTSANTIIDVTSAAGTLVDGQLAHIVFRVIPGTSAELFVDGALATIATTTTAFDASETGINGTTMHLLATNSSAQGLIGDFGDLVVQLDTLTDVAALYGGGSPPDITNHGVLHYGDDQTAAAINGGANLGSGTVTVTAGNLGDV